ncbi:MAG: 30S ribosomal protein S6e [Methanoregulaceae archaeon]|nr:30S ribosomal protein S6e [Methanoregulaceae archaeon]
MVDFKMVLSDPKTGRAYNVTVSGGAAGSLTGRKIGDELDGGIFGLPGYRLKITGGSDRNGTPARKDLPTAGRRKILLSGGLGFKPVMEGQRRRKSMRGNEIGSDFVQINATLTGYGEKPLEEYYPKEIAAEKSA